MLCSSSLRHGRLRHAQVRSQLAYVTCAARRASRAMAAPKLMSSMQGSFSPLWRALPTSHGERDRLAANEHRLTFQARVNRASAKTSSEPCPPPSDLGARSEENPPSRLVHGFERNVAFSERAEDARAAPDKRDLRGNVLPTRKNAEGTQRKLTAAFVKNRAQVEPPTNRAPAREHPAAHAMAKTIESSLRVQTCGA